MFPRPLPSFLILWGEHFPLSQAFAFHLCSDLAPTPPLAALILLLTLCSDSLSLTNEVPTAVLSERDAAKRAVASLRLEAERKRVSAGCGCRFLSRGTA